MLDKRNYVHEENKKAKMLEGIIIAVNPCPISSFQRGRLELAARFCLSDDESSKLKKSQNQRIGKHRNSSSFPMSNIRHIMSYSSLETGLSESFVNAENAC